MIFDGMEAKAEAEANTELLGDVMRLVLTSATDNAAQMIGLAQAFERLASDFHRLAESAETNKIAVVREFTEQAQALEKKAETMPRKSLKESLKKVAGKIREATRGNF